MELSLILTRQFLDFNYFPKVKTKINDQNSQWFLKAFSLPPPPPTQFCSYLQIITLIEHFKYYDNKLKNGFHNSQLIKINKKNS